MSVSMTGISQRDPNYYDFWNDSQTQSKVIEAIQTFWEENIKGKWESADGNCAFKSTYRVPFSELIIYSL